LTIRSEYAILKAEQNAVIVTVSRSTSWSLKRERQMIKAPIKAPYDVVYSVDVYDGTSSFGTVRIRCRDAGDGPEHFFRVYHYLLRCKKICAVGRRLLPGENEKLSGLDYGDYSHEDLEKIVAFLNMLGAVRVQDVHKV
jgi:hypothetical protein